MRVKVGNQNAARRTLHSYDCVKCPFSRQSVVFCIKVYCNEDSGFDDVKVSEDIFKL
jgi:hypothetical protein